MNRTIRVLVRPLGAALEVPAGSALGDALGAHGAEFPCGARGRCRGCRFRVLDGALEETEADARLLTPDERARGWRLACQARPDADLTVELRQWAGLILADDTPFDVEPAEGLGAAVDIGTTTIVAQLLDLETGRVLATQTGLNAQAPAGADVLSRITAALERGGADKLREAIRGQVAAMVRDLVAALPGSDRRSLARATLVGNTAMHHFFLGHDVAPLSRFPFEPVHAGGARMTGRELGWPDRAAGADVAFLPTLGGFVGSDILGVILATRLHESETVAGAADLGTNGELVVGNRDRLLVTSTAAGPAFEGARISQGMRAAPGAIDRVSLNGRGFAAHVVGGGKAAGICGSGLVDAVACALAARTLAPSGRLPGGPLALKHGIGLVQQDIRELQLAKGAIAAGIDLLMASLGVGPDAVDRFYLAGAFGNNLSIENAGRIGLVPFPPERVHPVGNAALLGAKMTLFLPGLGAELFARLLPRVRNVALDRLPEFHERFAQAMPFPEPS